MMFGNEIKKVLLAGIGAVAVTAEKSQNMIDMLVKKGEITVEQGKVLNEELKNNIKDAVSGTEKKAEDDISGKLASMTAEELAELRKKLDEIENS